MRTANALRTTTLALALLVAALATPAPSRAIPADPRPAEFVQPDGTRITLYLRGDEWVHWQEDTRGYAVVKEQGEWRYARLGADGQLEATAFRVGSVDPASVGLDRSVMPRISESLRMQRAQAHPSRVGVGVGGAIRLQATPPTGTIKNLVVLCRFNDQTVAAFGRAPSAYDSLFNAQSSTGFNAPTGSVRDYYLEASHLGLTLQSTVLNWVTLPQNEAYYAHNKYGIPDTLCPYPTNSAGMVVDALNALDATVNFAQFDQNNDGYVDAITFIHSGYGGEQNNNGPGNIWSHQGWLTQKWSGKAAWTSADKNANNVNVKVDLYHTEPARFGSPGSSDLTRVGVIAHETGHFFGLPDLYDVDKATDTTAVSGGIGNWCVMSSSWGWDNDQLIPPLPCAWCRIQLGWELPYVLTAPSEMITLSQAETNNAVAKSSFGFPSGEYLLLENRQPVGFDRKIPQGGLAVWHIDENVGGNTDEGYPGQPPVKQGELPWPYNGRHYKVALLQADGHYDLEKNVNKGDAGDLFRDVPTIALSEVTAPNTNAYQGGNVFPTADEISNVSASGPSMTFRSRTALWVDLAAPPSGVGTFNQPYNAISTAVGHVANDGIVICKGGTTHDHPYYTIPMWLKSWGGPTTFGP